MSYYVIPRDDELYHYGILGMKWGVRRYQNEDGSLTSAGRIRYYGTGGKARHYKDVMKRANKNYNKAFRGKDYRNWVKEDPRNRTGQRAQYELLEAQKALGGKKGMADAKYAYEHKKLAKYVNRDGSLTTAGKLKYWDTNKARGQARLQRDLDRDKNTPTTSEAARNKWKKTSDIYGLRNGLIANRSAINAALIGRQKDVTKYGRKNAKNIVKYATRTGLALATGRPIGAIKNTAKLAREATVGTAKAAFKTAVRADMNAVRGGLAGAYLAKEYGTVPGRAKQVARNAAALGLTRARNISLKDKALLNSSHSKSYNYYHNLEETAAAEKKLLNKANAASSKVASTVKNITNKNKKKKRN